MGDIEHLRLGFCSLIMQAKGSLISSFVAWLDLKVAEYKVYGHMILTEDSEGVGSDAWQYTTPAEPVSWPRSLPDSFHGHQAASHLGTNSTFMRSVPPSRRGLRAPYSRPVSLNNRPRPARPKSVTNLLKNAISRSSKSSTVVNARSGSSSGSGPSVSNSQPVILTAGTEVSTVSVPSITQSGTSETDYTAPGSSTESSTLMAASPSSCVTNEQNIKEEPGLLMSVESEDGDRLGGEQSMWLGDAATAVVEQSPSTSYAAQTSTGVTPNISSMTPSGSRGPSSTQVRSTGGVAQRGVLCTRCHGESGARVILSKPASRVTLRIGLLKEEWTTIMPVRLRGDYRVRTVTVPQSLNRENLEQFLSREFQRPRSTTVHFFRAGANRMLEEIDFDDETTPLKLKRNILNRSALYVKL